MGEGGLSLSPAFALTRSPTPSAPRLQVEALLHGHSYTAYPLGCAAALASLQLLRDPSTNPNMQPHGWLGAQWDYAAVAELSRHPLAARVVALGSVLALELKGSQEAAGAAGYVSAAAATAAVVRGLRARGVFARPLGGVVYMMVTPTTEVATCERLHAALAGALDECIAAGPAGVAALSDAEREGTLV